MLRSNIVSYCPEKNGQGHSWQSPQPRTMCPTTPSGPSWPASSSTLQWEVMACCSFRISAGRSPLCQGRLHWPEHQAHKIRFLPQYSGGRLVSADYHQEPRGATFPLYQYADCGECGFSEMAADSVGYLWVGDRLLW